MRIKSIFKQVVTSLVLMLSPLAMSEGTFGGGTVPWPWPWAKECPIDFMSLKGTWVMGREGVEATADSFIVIDTVWLQDRGAQYVSIEMMDSQMTTYASGYTLIHGNARYIQVRLHNFKGDPLGQFELKIYHKNQLQSCDPKELVPIVTIKRTPGNEKRSHYILRPRAPDAPEERF